MTEIEQVQQYTKKLNLTFTVDAARLYCFTWMSLKLLITKPQYGST